jgi:hypothetical protein
MDVAYATVDELTAFEAVGYKVDGIEGYIYPKTMWPQPPGTQKLLRRYNPARDDHAIFPESKQSAMANLGYTQVSLNDSLGFVYPNANGQVPTIQ